MSETEGVVGVLEARARAAEARASELRSALFAYGQHELGCAAGEGRRCDCGFDAAILEAG